ncbi:putative GABA transporter [Zopfia rhizophila CBS 207.26]|uniref:Putative GABA transporter n=1 Tax=Zopfia rhizophila CBS 207.26 TaxID=1314779 RepID=A0A6A6DNK3_9PEZI|nr:putative GABA transporter [Zopfia rhizophila CBS 207.26]
MVKELQLDTLASGKGCERVQLDTVNRLGKKPVLKRNFGFMLMLAFACTVMITREGVLLYTNGGFAGSIYKFILVWQEHYLENLKLTGCSLDHWVSMLAPTTSRKFLSYVIVLRWLTVVGWQAIVASGCYLSASLIQGLMVRYDSTCAPTGWQLMLLYWGVLVVSLSVNTIISRRLPNIEGLILILHTFGFFAILIPITYFVPHGDSQIVFTSFHNGGGWQTDGFSFMIWCVGACFSLLGADSAVHMSEEIRNPAKNIPRAIVGIFSLNGGLGIGMLIAALCCFGGSDRVLNTRTRYPFREIFSQAMGNPAGALTMSAPITILNICPTIFFVVTTSRMTWAFTRDKGTPGWRILNRTTLPIMSITLTMTIAVLTSFIGLGSSHQRPYTSYLIGNTLLLWRHTTDQIKPFSTFDTALTNTPDAEAVLNALGYVYLFTMLFFGFWPSEKNTAAEHMNYSSLMCGVVVIFSVVYYLVGGRKSYTGPVVELNSSHIVELNSTST